MFFTDRLKLRLSKLTERGNVIGPVHGGALVSAYQVVYGHLRSLDDSLLLTRTLEFVEDAIELGMDMGMVSRCSQGCNSCCTQQVAVTDPEIDFIMSDKSVTADFVKLKMQSEAKQFNTLTVEERRCAFITGSGCSIYKYRPIPCRLVHSKSLAHCLEHGETLPLIFDYAEISYGAYLSVLGERGLLKPSFENVLHKKMYKALQGIT